MTLIPGAGMGAAAKYLSWHQRLRRRLLPQVASGRSVLRAGDDPARLAINSGLSTRIRSRGAAIRNAEDALSALQTADGGLAQISSTLSRVRELAVAAASEVHAEVDRVALASEAGALLTEIDRVAGATNWNGADLLSQVHLDIGFVIDASGSMGGELAQVVASIDDMVQAFQDGGVDAEFGLARARNTLDFADGVVLASDIGSAGFSAALAGTPIAGGAMDPYSALLNASGANDFNGDGDDFTWRDETASHIIFVTDTGQETVLTPGNPSQSAVAADLAAAGVGVHVIAPTSRFATFSQIASLTGGGLYDIGNSSGSNIPTALDEITESLLGTAVSEAVLPLTVQLDIDGDASSELDLEVALDASRVGLGLTGLSLLSAGDAGDAIDTIDAAIDTVNSHRATIGAKTNRIGYAMGNLHSMQVNETASLSRSQDLDIAEASAELARVDILQQATIDLMARAQATQRELARRMYSSLGT